MFSISQHFLSVLFDKGTTNNERFEISKHSHGGRVLTCLKTLSVKVNIGIPHLKCDGTLRRTGGEV